MTSQTQDRDKRTADFTADIAPVVQRFAQRQIRCPDLQAVALAMAWYYWHSADDKRHLPPSVWARCGVRAALTGRDLPGLRSRSDDAWDHLDQYQGSGMGQAADRRPGPVETLIAREDAERFFSSLDPFERRMCDMLADGIQNREVARTLRRTPGAISQRRRRLMERHRTD